MKFLKYLGLVWGTYCIALPPLQPPTETRFEFRSPQGDRFLITRDANSFELKLHDVEKGIIIDRVSLEDWMKTAKAALELTLLSDAYNAKDRKAYEAEYLRKWREERVYREVRDILHGKLRPRKNTSYRRELLVGTIAMAPFFLAVGIDTRATLKQLLAATPPNEILGDVGIERTLFSFSDGVGVLAFSLAEKGKTIVQRYDNRVQIFLPTLVWERLLKDSIAGAPPEYRKTVEATLRAVHSSEQLPKHFHPKDYAFDIPFLIHLRNTSADRISHLEATFKHASSEEARGHIRKELRIATDDSLSVLETLTQRLYALGAME